MGWWFQKNRPSADPGPAAQQIDEEFAFHLDSAERDGRDAGLAEDDARAQARAAFGDVPHHRDACLRVAHGSLIMNKKIAWSAAALVALVLSYVAGLATPELMRELDGGSDWQRIGAFEGFVWQDDTPVVLIENRWYALEAINGRPVDEILTAAADTFDGQTRHRFTEDLYEVLVAVGEPGDRIDATLRDPETGALVEKPGLEMTEEKRRRAKGEDWKEQGDVPPVPVVRHADLLFDFSC